MSCLEKQQQFGDTGHSKPISIEQRRKMLETFQLMADKWKTKITVSGGDEDEEIFVGRTEDESPKARR